MMRSLICVCLAGAAAYYVLIPTQSEPEWNSGTKVSTARLEASRQADPQLRSSWGSTLKSLGRDPEAQAVVSPQRETPKPRQEAVYWQGDVKPKQASQPATSVTAKSDMPAKADLATTGHVAWARVILAAKAHREASVSSPVTKFYPIGTELQIVGRESSWIELLDPKTQQRGFIFEKYLVAIDGPTPTQSLTQVSAKPPLAAASKAKSPAARTSRQASKTVRQATNDVQATHPNEARPDTKGERLTKKEARRERKLFRMFGGREPAPWTVGEPR